MSRDSQSAPIPTIPPCLRNHQHQRTRLKDRILRHRELDDAHLGLDAGFAELAEHGAGGCLCSPRGASNDDRVVGGGGGGGRVRVGGEDLDVVELLRDPA